MDTRTAARDAPGHPPTTAPHLSYLAAADLDPFNHMSSAPTAPSERCSLRSLHPYSRQAGRQAGRGQGQAGAGECWRRRAPRARAHSVEPRSHAARARPCGAADRPPRAPAGHPQRNPLRPGRESLVAPDRLPTPLAERLTLEGTSIGRLLTGWSLELRGQLPGDHGTTSPETSPTTSASNPARRSPPAPTKS